MTTSPTPTPTATPSPTFADRGWPPCRNCGAPVDDLAPGRGLPVHHYWTEEVDCITNMGVALGTTAAA